MCSVARPGGDIHSDERRGGCSPSVMHRRGGRVFALVHFWFGGLGGVGGVGVVLHVCTVAGQPVVIRFLRFHPISENNGIVSNTGC